MYRRPKEIDQQAILVIGFLGAVVFAALVFVLQDEHTIENTVNTAWNFNPFGTYYFQALITIMAIDSLCFIISSINMIWTSTDEKMMKSKIGDWTFRLFETGTILLFAFVPFLLLPFTIIGGAIVVFFELVIVDRMAKWSANS